MVNLTFADEGIEVVAVSSGDMAERRLPEVSPDLVLADIFMPGKNGYELCEAIKENSQFRHVPVVLLVGAFEPFDQAEANRVKADAHLTKPFESRTLVETVRRLISDQGNTAAPTSKVNDEAEEAIEALSPAAASTPLVAPVPNIDFSAMMPENNLDASPVPKRTTGSLGSPRPDMARGAFDMGGSVAPEAQPVSETLPSASEPIDVFEFSGNGDFAVGDSTRTFRLDEHEMLQDFERSDVLEVVEYSHEPRSFPAESNSLLDVNISGAGEGESWFSADTLGNLQADHQHSDNGWQASADNSTVAQGSAELSTQSEVGVTESTDTACATLLAVDEPLGDVLFDEAVSIDRLALSQSSTSDSLGFEFTESEVSDVKGKESTHFDLVEAVQEPAHETSFEFLHTPAEEAAPAVEMTAAVEEQAAVVQETVVHEPAAAVHEPAAVVHEPAAVVHEPAAVVHEPAAVVHEPAAVVHEPAAVVHEPAAVVHEPAAVVHEPAAAVQEPAAFVQEPAFVVEPPAPAQEPVAAQQPTAAVQESFVAEEPNAILQEPAAVAEPPADVQEPHAAVVEPVMQEAAAEVKEENPLPEATQASHDVGSSFDWTTPHAATQSTAELESLVMPVETHEAQTEAPVAADPVMTETKEAVHRWTDEETRFTPIDIEAVAVEDATAEHAVQSESEAETGFVVSSVLAEEPAAMVESSVGGESEEARSAAVASDLSAAAIDEIVRRVLSQLSESVVREVAWEVVPDCVERVIEQLTRESLSKRT